MKRAIDFGLALVLMVPLLPLAALIAVAVVLTSPGPALYWSDRIGKGGVTFRMPKFRTMRVGTPAVATHLMRDPQRAITRLGAMLRRTSLDEIPQLWSVLVGDMSFVGPRPALFNQSDLIDLREAAGVNELRPGITGWAQINGRDELPIPMKVAFDKEYLSRQSMLFDFQIICKTAVKVLGDKSVVH